MLEQLIHKLNEHDRGSGRYTGLLREISIPAKTILLNEGELSQNIYFVRKGCLRLWFNNQGTDITFQFFFEDQAVSCLLGRKPSLFTLESIETSTLVILPTNDFESLLKEIPELKDGFMEIILQRLENYSSLFLSRIKDKPQKRYEDLIHENPQILKRVPQYYIASYLGITPVSLSRIRNRKH